MIVKVKEPIEPDLKRLRKDHLLFCYLHLAALPELTRRLCDIGLTAVAFETVEDRDGRLPLLAPMSDIAGRLSMQYAHHLLHQPQGGKGILLGGVPAARARPRRGARRRRRRRQLARSSPRASAPKSSCSTRTATRWSRRARMGANVTGLYPHVADVADAVREADVVIGAVLVTGARAPHVVSADMVRSMEHGQRHRRHLASTRAAASKPRGPPPGKRPRTSGKASRTSASPTCRAPCRAPRRRRCRRPLRRMPAAWRMATGATIRAWSAASTSKRGKVTHPALHELSV